GAKTRVSSPTNLARPALEEIQPVRIARSFSRVKQSFSRSRSPQPPRQSKASRLFSQAHPHKMEKGASRSRIETLNRIQWKID
ncbi:unnamed protein product, partial [Nesidiocoris tenuis]